MAIRVILAMAALALGASAQSAQDAPPAAGIFGRVVNVQTHEPVRRAVVKVYTSKDLWDEITDAEGRFCFPTLVKGEYTLIAHRDGYTDRWYKVEYSDFDAHVELPIELRPQGLVTGKVTDDSGEPLEGATVEALGARARGGPLTDVFAAAQTNDLGEYRLAALDPGTYRLRARYREGRSSEFDPAPMTMATAYYGGSENAAEIMIKGGSLATGVDFTLKLVRPATLRGTLHTESGVLMDRATLWLMGKTGEGGGNGQVKDGAFAMRDIGPGSYTLSAQTLDKTLFGMVTIRVGGDDVGSIDILLRPVPKLEAQIVMEGPSPGPMPQSVFLTRSNRIALLPMEIGHPDRKGKFALLLISGDYTLSVDTTGSNLAMRKATLDGDPVADGKIHIGESPLAHKLVIVVGARQ